MVGVSLGGICWGCKKIAGLEGFYGWVEWVVFGGICWGGKKRAAVTPVEVLLGVAALLLERVYNIDCSFFCDGIVF